MTDLDKLELLARLLPYVSDDDESLDLVDFSKAVADRCEQDYQERDL